MKNKELLNICYKFLNRFITADKLVELISNVDRVNYTDYDNQETNKMLDEIKDIILTVPNTEDEYVKARKESNKKFVNKLEQIADNVDFLAKEAESLKQSCNKEIDSHERWSSVAKYITSNKYFNELFDSLNDYELLEFIAQYIQVPCPPSLEQEDFDKLVKVGIEHDEREWLWRLAFNYDYSNLDFDKITNYFIKVNDGYYISELICAVSDKLNINDIIDKINDEALIKDILGRKNYLSTYITDE